MLSIVLASSLSKDDAERNGIGTNQWNKDWIPSKMLLLKVSKKHASDLGGGQTQRKVGIP